MNIEMDDVDEVRKFGFPSQSVLRTQDRRFVKWVFALQRYL